MKKYFFYIFLLFFVFLLGCEDKPSDEDILNAIKVRYSKIGKIENFRRIDDYKTKDGKYVVEYEFDLILDIDKLRKISKKKNPLETITYTTTLLLVSIQCPDILESSDTCRIRDKITFVKGKDGWIPVK